MLVDESAVRRDTQQKRQHRQQQEGNPTLIERVWHKVEVFITHARRRRGVCGRPRWAVGGQRFNQLCTHRSIFGHTAMRHTVDIVYLVCAMTYIGCGHDAAWARCRPQGCTREAPPHQDPHRRAKRPNKFQFCLKKHMEKVTRSYSFSNARSERSRMQCSCGLSHLINVTTTKPLLHAAKTHTHASCGPCLMPTSTAHRRTRE
jgi:hypothetical protein